MPFEPPRWWWTGLVVALVLLATGGALNAVEQGMRDNYVTDGCGPPWGGARSVEEQPEDVDCGALRLQFGIVDAVSRATFGPGIAMAILAGVYLLGSALAIALGGGRNGEQDEPEKASARAPVQERIDKQGGDEK
jgi:hypothetical protein